jgi:predicted nucleic acid-binding protein
MIPINAHFDGRVIVRDEPIDLPPNQALVVRIEAKGVNDPSARASALAWPAANASDITDVPSDLAHQYDHLSVRRSQEGCLNSTAAWFADTSFWIALSHKSDQHHARAFACRNYLTRSEGFILTTEAVLWQWMNTLRIPGDGARFAAGTIADAVRFYDARGDKDWSLTDCLSFLVMEQHRIPRSYGQITTSDKQVWRLCCLKIGLGRAEMPSCIFCSDQGQIRFSGRVEGSELTSPVFWECSGGNHDCIVSRERAGREVDRDSHRLSINRSPQG